MIDTAIRFAFDITVNRDIIAELSERRKSCLKRSGFRVLHDVLTLTHARV
jgi:hypothetical protein